MVQLSIPGTRGKVAGETRLHGDEAMRQHARRMRKAMKEMAMVDKLKEKIAEHETAIARNQQVAQGLQQQLQTLAVDVERRQGAIMALRELMGPQVPAEVPPPTETPDAA